MRQLRCRQTVLVVALFSLVASLSSCGDSGGSGSGANHEVDVNIDIPAVDGTIGAGGGSVASGDASIDVPEGALPDEQVIALGSAASPALPAGVITVGPTVEIGPSGTAFDTPATVTLPFVAGALPSGRSAAEIRVYRAHDPAGTYTPLFSSVDSAGGTVSAETDQLSHFVPALPRVTSGEPVCPEMGACDCAPVYAERPLNVLGQADIDRPIREVCLDLDTDQLTVLSYTVPPSDDPFEPPDHYYLTVLGGPELVWISDQETELTDITGPLCGPAESTIGYGTDPEGRPWRVHYREVTQDWTGETLWIHAYVEIGGAYFSFNRHLNEEAPYTDTDSLYDDSNGVAARFLDDGSVRFYLHVYHERHIDVIQVDNLDAIIENPLAFTDEEGFSEPAIVDRFEVAPGRHRFAISYNSIVVSAANGAPDTDLVYLFDYSDGGLRQYRVSPGSDRTMQFEPVDPLPVEDVEFWGQSGWEVGGLDSRGRVYIQSDVASFSTSKLVAFDPHSGTLLGDWEIGCLDAPDEEGFMAIPYEEGLVVRFSFDSTDDDNHRTMFVRDGRLEAIGLAPQVFDFGSGIHLLTGEETRRLYTGDRRNGELMVIGVP